MLVVAGPQASPLEAVLLIQGDGGCVGLAHLQGVSSPVSSQIEMHTIYGGVVPEIASRKHVEAISGLADRAVSEAGLTKFQLDAIAAMPSTRATLSKHSPAASSCVPPSTAMSV